MLARTTFILSGTNTSTKPYLSTAITISIVSLRIHSRIICCDCSTFHQTSEPRPVDTAAVLCYGYNNDSTPRNTDEWPTYATRCHPELAARTTRWLWIASRPQLRCCTGRFLLTQTISRGRTPPTAFLYLSFPPRRWRVAYTISTFSPVCRVFLKRPHAYASDIRRHAMGKKQSSSRKGGKSSARPPRSQQQTNPVLSRRPPRQPGR